MMPGGAFFTPIPMTTVRAEALWHRLYIEFRQSLVLGGRGLHNPYGGTTLRFGRDNYPAFCPNRFREYSCARDRAEVRLQHMLADNPDKFTSCQVLIRNRTPQRSTRRATSNIVHQK